MYQFVFIFTMFKKSFLRTFCVTGQKQKLNLLINFQFSSFVFSLFVKYTCFFVFYKQRNNLISVSSKLSFGDFSLQTFQMRFNILPSKRFTVTVAVVPICQFKHCSTNTITGNLRNVKIENKFFVESIFSDVCMCVLSSLSISDEGTKLIC